jgi:glutaredoxin
MPQAQRCQYANDVVILDEGAAIQDAMEKISGQRTVPNIHIMEEFKGGNDEIQEMGPELDHLLQQVAVAEASTAQGSNSPVSESA